MRFPDFARFEMLVNEGLACFHFLWVHRIGLGYLQNKSFLQLYPMVEWLSRRKLSFSRFLEDFGIFGILRGKFLFHLFGGLS